MKNFEEINVEFTPLGTPQQNGVVEQDLLHFISQFVQ